MNFDYSLELEEDSLPIKYVYGCKALSTGGVLIYGIASDYFLPTSNSRGFLLLYHPPTNVSIKESTISECAVFPNPAQSQFTVTNTKNAAIHLYNILGQKIKQVKSTEENTIIQTSDLSAGMYILKVEKENMVITKKTQIVK